MKIAYLIGTLATQGGTAKMIVEKANMYATILGHDVTIVTMLQPRHEPNTFLLSDRVKQVFLEFPLHSMYKYKYPMRLWAKWHTYRLLRKEATKAIMQIDPDILLGASQVYADLVSTIRCRAKKVIECHEAKMFTHAHFGAKQSLLSRLYNSIARYRYFYIMERNADVICTLTEGDKVLWKKAKRVEVIPNFSTMHVSTISDCTSKRVIVVGRIEGEKGYSRLLQIWKIVTIRHPNWKLDIFGEGGLQSAIEILIKDNDIKNIKIHPFTHDISKEYANSSICAVTSYFEGFSLVILEAMKHGVPCIAFDCRFGPGSIIQDSLNGFLVEDGDIRLFAERLCLMIEDTKMRKEFSQEAIKRAKAFEIDEIAIKWNTLFEDIINHNSKLKT